MFSLAPTAPQRGVTPIDTVLRSVTAVKVGQDRFSI